MKNRFKKLLAVIMCLCVSLCAVVSAHAEEESFTTLADETTTIEDSTVEEETPETDEEITEDEEETEDEEAQPDSENTKDMSYEEKVKLCFDEGVSSVRASGEMFKAFLISPLFWFVPPMGVAGLFSLPLGIVMLFGGVGQIVGAPIIALWS